MAIKTFQFMATWFAATKHKYKDLKLDLCIYYV